MKRGVVVGTLLGLPACHVSGTLSLHANATADGESKEMLGDHARRSPSSAPVLVLDIDFAFGSARLTDSDKKTLSKPETLAALCSAIATYKNLTVEGHADSRGSDDYNLQLTQQRAESVREALLANALCRIDPLQLTAVGVGKRGPKRCQEPPECLGKDNGPPSCEPCWNENRMTIISIAELTAKAATTLELSPGCSRVLVLGEERGSRMCE